MCKSQVQLPLPCSVPRAVSIFQSWRRMWRYPRLPTQFLLAPVFQWERVPHGVGIPVAQQGPATHKPKISVRGPVPHQCNILHSSGDQLAQHSEDTSSSLTQQPSGVQFPTNPGSQWGPDPYRPASQQGPVPHWLWLYFRSSVMSLLPACSPDLSMGPDLSLHPPMSHPLLPPPPPHSTSDIASTGHALEKTWQGDREGK